MARINLLYILLYILKVCMLSSVGLDIFLVSNLTLLFDEVSKPLVNQGSLLIFFDLAPIVRRANESSKVV